MNALPPLSVSIRAEDDVVKARSNLQRYRIASADSQKEPSHKKATTDDSKDRSTTFGDERKSLSAAESTLGVILIIVCLIM
jgi:hypothetical protein